MMNSPPKSVPRIYVGTLFGGYSVRQRLQSDKWDTLISPGCIGDLRRSERGGGKQLIRKYFCCLNVKMIFFRTRLNRISLNLVCWELVLKLWNLICWKLNLRGKYGFDLNVNFSGFIVNVNYFNSSNSLYFKYSENTNDSQNVQVKPQYVFF